MAPTPPLQCWSTPTRLNSVNHTLKQPSTLKRGAGDAQIQAQGALYNEFLAFSDRTNTFWQ